MGAGFVGAIEAVEQVGQVGRIDGLAAVAHGKDGISRRSPQRHGHGAPGSVYLQALSKSTATARWRRAALPRTAMPARRALPGKIPFEGHGLEGEGLALHKAAEVDDGRGAFRGLGALRGRSGQIEHIGHEALHALRLHLGALNPLALAGDGVTAALPQDGVVGEDDRERGLQFVGRVGYELLLLGPGC